MNGARAVARSYFSKATGSRERERLRDKSETTIPYIPGSRVTQDPKLINDSDDWLCGALRVHACTPVSVDVTITHTNYTLDKLW